MGEDIAMGGIFLVVVLGFWFTRNSKGADRLPGVDAIDGMADAKRQVLEHGEGFEDEKPQDY